MVTAEELDSQAKQLIDQISFFNIGTSDISTTGSFRKKENSRSKSKGLTVLSSETHSSGIDLKLHDDLDTDFERY